MDKINGYLPETFYICHTARCRQLLGYYSNQSSSSLSQLSPLCYRFCLQTVVEEMDVYKIAVLLSLLSGLIACLQINAQVLLHCTERQRRRKAQWQALITLHNPVIRRPRRSRYINQGLIKKTFFVTNVSVSLDFTLTARVENVVLPGVFSSRLIGQWGYDTFYVSMYAFMRIHVWTEIF